MGWMKEFRDFINRGNVIDLGVGIVIGTAFTGIVNSFVNDLLMPVIGILTGGVDFTGLGLKMGEAVVAYGNFVQAILNFLIIAFAVFWLVRAINRLNRRKKDQPAEPEAPSDDIKLLREIRDLLKAQNAVLPPGTLPPAIPPAPPGAPLR